MVHHSPMRRITMVTRSEKAPDFCLPDKDSNNVCLKISKENGLFYTFTLRIIRKGAR